MRYSTMVGPALAYHHAGIKIVAIDPITRIAHHPYSNYKTSPPTEEEIRKLFRWDETKVAIMALTGEISGGLAVLDFDKPGFFERWYEKNETIIHSLNLPIQRTGSGKYHVFFRSETEVRHIRLAMVEGKNSTMPQIAIELLGNGNHVTVTPSLHPSGGRYTLEQGDLSRIPVLNESEYQQFLTEARKLTEVLPPEGREQKPTEQKDRDHSKPSVIESFNLRYSITEILTWYGYTRHSSSERKNSNNSEYWSRPESSDPNVFIQNGKSFHHSSNDPLGDQRWKTPFDVFKVWSHNNSIKEAVKAAAKLLDM